MFGILQFGLLVQTSFINYKQTISGSRISSCSHHRKVSCQSNRNHRMVSSLAQQRININEKNDIPQEEEEEEEGIPTNNEFESALSKIMNISTAHFMSQALHTFVKLKIPDILNNNNPTTMMTTKEIANKLKEGRNLKNDVNEDALYRTLRMMGRLDVVTESYTNNSDCDGSTTENDQPYQTESTAIMFDEVEQMKFKLTSFGKFLIQDNGISHSTQSSLSSCILHWMEKPLNDSWQYLPSYILNDVQKDPFEQANGISSDYFYNAQDNPQSLLYANNFVKMISDSEINSIVNYFDWSMFEGKVIVDIGGYNGKVFGAIASHYDDVDMTLISIDLPNVISSIKKSSIPDRVQLRGGNVMDAASLPKCDVVFMKHFLDRCMWTEEETVKILETCSSLIPDEDGMIILGEAAIPSAADHDKMNKSDKARDLPIALDALYLLVGRERQRTEKEWESLAKRANLVLDQVIQTGSPSCHLLVLRKRKV